MKLAHHSYVVLLVAAALAGCGGHKSSATVVSTSPQTTPSTVPTSTAPLTALQAEATSAAAGDIPDNQVFIEFVNAKAGYTIKYPEGWAQQGGAGAVTFRDKNNIVRIVVAKAAVPHNTADASLKGLHLKSGPKGMTVGGRPAFKFVYTTQSAPNAVTGKRVTLTVDRYYLWRGGKEAIVDLGSPVGVDNVDAYRMMINSFRWK